MLMWEKEIRRQEPTGWECWRCGLDDQVGGPVKWTRNKGSFTLAPQRLPLRFYRPLDLDHTRIFFQQGLRRALLHVQGGVLLERRHTGLAFPPTQGSHPRPPLSISY